MRLMCFMEWRIMRQPIGFIGNIRLASDGRYIGFDNDGNLETSEHKLENIPHVSPERLRYLCFRTK